MLRTLLINLERSPERLRAMRRRFPSEQLIRVRAVDGTPWWNGSFDADGRPQWSEKARKELVSKGILAGGNVKITPCELGCTLSHRRIWLDMVARNIEKVLVLEDDIRLCKDLVKNLADSVHVPDDADVVFLTGANKFHDFGSRRRACLTLDVNRRVIRAYGTSAYIITLDGARRALEATKTNRFPLPTQWFQSAFKGYRYTHHDVEPIKSQGYAYGQREALIELSNMHNKSTMTPSGRKPWRIKGVA